MSHIVCALVAVRTMNVRTMTLGMLAGVFVVVLYSLAFGRYHYDPLDGNYSFVGAFSSKNQLGFFSSLGIYFAFACLFILREHGLGRLLALSGGGLSGYALIASQSATSIIATAATLAVMMGLSLILLFAPRTRKAFLAVGLVLALCVAVIHRLELRRHGPAARRLRQGCYADGADLSLGGRSCGGCANAGRRRRILRLLGSGLCRGRAALGRILHGLCTGFHFHNTYIEVLVELGVVGLALAALVSVRVTVGHLLRLLNLIYDFQLAHPLRYRGAASYPIILRGGHSHPLWGRIVPSLLCGWSAGRTAGDARAPFLVPKPHPRRACITPHELECNALDVLDRNCFRLGREKRERRQWCGINLRL